MRLILSSIIVFILTLCNFTVLNVQAEEKFNRDNLQKFIDVYFTSEKLEENNITSAVFTFVKGNEILFNKGFGYADLESEIPANSETTAFRVGSIGKLLVGTAVAQLIEQGKLDLDRNINEYLTTFEIPNTYEDPITLRHLVTHTAGFDEEYIGLFSSHYSEFESLEKTLREQIPKRIREPGLDYQYDNFGVSLAGHIVEVVSGMPFDEYVQKNIFTPLEMTNSSARLKDEIIPNLAYEYAYKNGEYQKLPLYGVLHFPSGAMTATGEDMGKFLMAHMNEARNEANLLFQSEDKIMYKTMHTPHPKVSGNTINFFERSHGEERLLHHGGDTLGTHSYLMISPTHDIGLFISFVGGAPGMMHSITENFYEKFLPLSISASTQEEPKYNVSLQEFEGTYTFNRYSRNEFLKFIWLASPTAKIKATKEGLSIKLLEEQNFKRVGEYLFINEKGQHIFFKTNDKGEVRAARFEDVVFDRSPWYQVSSDDLILLLSILIVFVISTIIYIVKILRRKTSSKILWNDHFIFLTSILYLLFLGGFAYVLSSMVSFADIVLQIPLLLKVSMTLPIIGFLFTVALTVKVLIDWKQGNMSFFQKVYYPLFIAASFLFIFIMHYYRLVGFYY